jgi:virulence-associated protein VapD
MIEIWYKTSEIFKLTEMKKKVKWFIICLKNIQIFREDFWLVEIERKMLEITFCAWLR